MDPIESKEHQILKSTFFKNLTDPNLEETSSFKLYVTPFGPVVWKGQIDKQTGHPRGTGTIITSQQQALQVCIQDQVSVYDSENKQELQEVTFNNDFTIEFVIHMIDKGLFTNSKCYFRG